MAEKAKPQSAKIKSAKVKAAKSATMKSSAKTPKAGKAAKPSKAKVKAVKPAARGASAEPAVSEVETFHVLLAPLPGLIHTARPQTAAESIEFSSFDDARERAIDHLIELIEEAERQLHALRRATRHDEFGR